MIFFKWCLVASALLFLLQIPTFAKIVEISKIEDVESYIDSDSTLLIDLDNTLIAPIGNRGSDAWFYYTWNIFKNERRVQDPYSHVLQVWLDTQSKVKVKPVEETTVPLIKKLQKNKIPILIATSRNLKLKEVTLAQIKNSGMEFNLTFRGMGELYFPKELFPNGKDPALFHQGILMSGSNKKGDVYRALMETSRVIPKKVVFVDDKKENLESLETSMSALKIPFTGLRYNYLDQKVAAYNYAMTFLMSLGMNTSQALEILDYAD